MIFITGATGNIGGHVAKALAAQGITAKALYRKPKDKERIRAMGHEPVEGNLNERSSLVKAMRGCEKLFLLPPPTPDQAALEANAIAAAQEAGVAYVLKISAGDANVTSRVPWAKAHAEGELALHRSKLRWTILRPSAFYQNFETLEAPIKKGFLPIAAGRGRAAYIDARDVAEVAVRILLENHHEGATYFLTGPEALSMWDIADALSTVLKRGVRYVNLPVPLYWASLVTAGLDRWLRNGLIAQYAGVVAKGHDIAVTNEVARLTGRPPKTFVEYAKEAHARFA